MNLFLAVPFATIASAWSLRQFAKRRSHAKNSSRANESTHCDFANIGEGSRDSGHISLLGDTGTPPQTSSRFLLVKFSTDGDHFTTWVQDQKVDDWTDARLKTGGVGLYSDRGESRNLKNGSLRVAPLVIKK